MTSDEFGDFLTFCAMRYKWPAIKVGKALGVTANTITHWRRKGAPRHVALSCAAIAFGLPAWRKVHSLAPLPADVEAPLIDDHENDKTDVDEGGEGEGGDDFHRLSFLVNEAAILDIEGLKKG